MGERREVESPGRISQNDILLKFPLGFFLYQCGNPYIPSSLHKEILLVRISSLTKRKTHGNIQGQPWVFLFVKEEILTREKSSWECGGEGVESNEFFSSSKRKSSWGKNPRGRGGGEVEVTKENISKWYSIEVSMRFFTSSKRKSSYPIPLPNPQIRKFTPWEFPLWQREKLVATS